MDRRPEHRTLRRLWMTQLTQQEMAHRLGVSRRTITRWAAELELEWRPDGMGSVEHERAVARRREIARRTRAGQTDQEIAAALGLALETVEVHRRAVGIYRKLPEPIDREELARLWRLGFLDREMAKRLDSTPGTVQVIRSREGLVRSP